VGSEACFITAMIPIGLDGAAAQKSATVSPEGHGATGQGLTRRSTGAADSVEIEWRADWRPSGQLWRYPAEQMKQPE